MRRILVGLMAAMVISVMAVGAAMADPGNGGGPDAKVIVCKYVGTPGPNEVLQTGQNPISVSVNALNDAFDASLPFPQTVFSDAQGFSVAVRYATGPTDNGDALTDCGTTVVQPTEVTPVAPVLVPATCDSGSSVSIPDQPEGVLVDVQTVNGVETVTFSADEGYVLADGVQAVYTFTLSGATGDCGGGGGGGGGNGGGGTPPPVAPPLTGHGPVTHQAFTV